MMSTNFPSCNFTCVFLTFFLTTFFHQTTSTGAGNDTDLEALLAFKSGIIHDPTGALSSWNGSSQFCQWNGVTCSKRRQRVTVLDLSFLDLGGTISPYIGNMSFLTEISLLKNKLVGKIPPQIGRLFRLIDLDLRLNSLDGEIPASLSNCSSLMYLTLFNNKLEGRIPREIGELTNLRELLIHFNNLTGEITDSVGNLSSLESFSVVGNQLVGQIPVTFGQLSKLTEVTLGSNHLSGSIPASIYNLSLLNSFSVSYNNLTGTLPSEIGLIFPNLKVLQLSGNYFSGNLPKSFANATKLERIEISDNNFTGKISIDFGNLKNLKFLSLSNNNLGTGEVDEMEFIRSLSNCSKFQVLEIGYNQLKGELPNRISNFSTQIYYFSITYNPLYGRIPSWIFDLSSLTELVLCDTELTGSIPPSIGNLSKLERLRLRNNKLSGTIPFSIGNLSTLSEISLSNNSLNGDIPSSIGDCHKLELVELSHNNFSGTIPVEIFRIPTLSISLNLSHNSLHGEVPSEAGELINLSILDISENELSGEIPNSIGSCIKLESLHLNGNNFHGSIPSSFRSLRGLRDLDISSNNLSGIIPDFLEKFALLNLNLSYNNFEGTVPTEGAFENATAISIIGNAHLCGGISSLQLPKCGANKSSDSKNDRIRVLLIIIIVSFVCMAISMFSLYCWLKRRRKARPSRATTNDTFLNVSYEDLLRATNGFSHENAIGVGSYGTVYRGILNILDSHVVVAVKVFNLTRQGASRSFLDECDAIKNVRHRNILKIITSCSSIDFQGNDFKALVYEFMLNGSLDKWLHQEADGDQRQSLSLQQRVDVAADVASALHYLHNSSGRSVVHCDLKPSNILLGGDMVARIGDFGQARSLLDHYHSNSSQSRTVGISGTIGYTPPEYGLGGEISIKGDIYSYGICVLEMIIGKRPTDPTFKDGLNLHNYAKTLLVNGMSWEILDPMLLDDITEALNDNQRQLKVNLYMDCLNSMIKIGVACSSESSQDRINMSVVVRELHLIKKSMRS